MTVYTTKARAIQATRMEGAKSVAMHRILPAYIDGRLVGWVRQLVTKPKLGQ